jgi:hypothetical protein
LWSYDSNNCKTARPENHQARLPKPFAAPEANVIKAADMMIARRADTRARADFATWNMMAKLNGASSLPPEAQSFLERYRSMLQEKTEAEAAEAIIQLIYKSYYGEMGGGGEAPNIRVQPVVAGRTSGNVTAFKRPSTKRPRNAGPKNTGFKNASPRDAGARNTSGPQAKPRLPVALIFACLVIVYTGFRYFFR